LGLENGDDLHPIYIHVHASGSHLDAGIVFDGGVCALLVVRAGGLVEDIDESPGWLLVTGVYNGIREAYLVEKDFARD